MERVRKEMMMKVYERVMEKGSEGERDIGIKGVKGKKKQRERNERESE